MLTYLLQDLDSIPFFGDLRPVELYLRLMELDLTHLDLNKNPDSQSEILSQLVLEVDS